MTKADSMGADCCEYALAFVRRKPPASREMPKPVVLPRRVWTSPSPLHHSGISPKILASLSSGSSRMKISDLLWSPPEREVVARDSPVAGCAKPAVVGLGTGAVSNVSEKSCFPSSATFTAVPDKKRKKRYYMSATQKRHHRDHEAFESRVLNLTLDINDLRQEVMRLLEYRDLQVTRLLLNRVRLGNELLKTVEGMMRGVKENSTAAPECRLARNITPQTNSARGSVGRGGVYEFVTRLDKARFSCVISSMQAVFAEDEGSANSEDTAAVRRVCGAGGCMVEVAGKFTFPFMHHLAILLFPHAAGDEMLLARVIGVRMTCPVRFFLYFNARRELVRQVAQADILPALQEARPREIAMLMNSSEV